MTLRANRYPDAWQFSSETPAPPHDYPGEDRVKVFVDLFSQYCFFGRIIVWEKSSWFTERYLPRRTVEGYCIIDSPDELSIVRCAIESMATTGDMSVLFVPTSTDVFLERIIAGRHYGTPQEIVIGTAAPNDPLDRRRGQSIVFLESEAFRSGEHILAFSHDAEFLYEIFR